MPSSQTLNELNSDSESESVVYDKPFTVSGNTPLGFGKLKGKPHNDLLLPDNAKYAKWILDQGEGFRYNSTREWVMKALERKKLTKKEFEALKVKPLEQCSTEEIEQYFEYLKLM